MRERYGFSNSWVSFYHAMYMFVCAQYMSQYGGFLHKYSNELRFVLSLYISKNLQCNPINCHCDFLLNSGIELDTN
jgi:hypothetical protein